MKSIAILPALALAVLGATASPSGGEFVNDIAVASHLYMLSDTQNDVFVQPLIKRWRPYDDFVRFSMDRRYGRFMRHLGAVVSLDKPVDGAELTIKLVNSDKFETVKTLKTKLRVGQKGAGSGEVCAQIIGDSYTHGRFYEQALLKSGFVPKLRLVGLLKAGEGQYNEGRGGLALSSYFNVPKREVQFYHGFMQPEGRRYWGVRQFWVMAWRCFRGTQPKGFEPTYSCSRFDRCLPRFDEKTGVLTDPRPGDLQFDSSAKAMLEWDGSTWKRIDEKSLSWSFDYVKYLAMWDVPAPRFLFVLLGLNDFRHELEADFSQWAERIAVVKDSYMKACPAGRFVICIPCSTCGSIDNAAGDFTPYQNAAMWRFRDWLIKSFDNREDEGYYLLDTGVAIDNEHGYALSKGTASLPYYGAKGESRLKVQSGVPHPYPNYSALGLPLAAFIQYHR